MQPLGAQIAEMLRSRGVDTVFGIPGVHNVELYRGLAGAGITHVLARHEQGAGFMADGYARATGRPGVAFVITGPGLTNIMTPMGQAYSDSVPLLVLSSCLNRADLGAGRNRLHDMRDQQGAAATVCDWSKTAMEPDTAYQLIDRALSEFDMSRPCPKHIQIPIDVLASLSKPAPETKGAHRVAGEVDVSIIADLIPHAERPLFIFGGGARTAGPVHDLLAASGAACFTTYAGRGTAGDRYPLNFGAFLARPETADIIASADLVIAIGTQLSEVDLWRDHLGHCAPLVRVDIDPDALCDAQRADHPVLARAEVFVPALYEALKGQQPATGWSSSEVAEARVRWRAEVDAERPGIAPVCDALRDVLPKDTLVFSDMTQLAYVAKEIWELAAPGLWHHPSGFGALGYALPAAIGGKMGTPHKPVVAIAGDYGFQYTMQELSVAVELELCLPIILWDNGKLKEIEDYMVRSQIAPNAVEARNPDFCDLAKAFGAAASAPKSITAMQADVRDALERCGPTLIHVTPEILD